MSLKKFALVMSISLGMVSAASAAPGNIPNDTATRILSVGGSCSEIIPQEAYYTLFGARGGHGKALVVKAAIQNRAFEKKVALGHANGQTAWATPTDSYWQVPVAISFDGQSAGFDYVTLIDRNVGPEFRDIITLSVMMNGDISNCIFTVGK